MALSLLNLVRAACAELGIVQPTLVAGSTDLGTVQFLGMLNALGRDLQSGFDWQALCVEYRFSTQFLTATGTTTANSAVVTGLSSTTGLDSTYMATGTGMAQDCYVLTNDSASQVTLSQVATASGPTTLSFCKTKYTMPTDYSRPIDETQYDKTRHWAVQGPQTAQQWQWLKSGYISTGPRMKFRPLGGYFQTWPPLASAEYLGMEYVSGNWARTSAGAGGSSFVSDADTCVFPDALMIVGLKDRFTMAKGFARSYESEYERQLNLAKAADVGGETLSMRGPRNASVLLDINNLPDTGYGS